MKRRVKVHQALAFRVLNILLGFNEKKSERHFLYLVHGILYLPLVVSMKRRVKVASSINSSGAGNVIGFQ